MVDFTFDDFDSGNSRFNASQSLGVVAYLGFTTRMRAFIGARATSFQARADEQHGSETRGSRNRLREVPCPLMCCGFTGVVVVVRLVARSRSSSCSW